MSVEEYNCHCCDESIYEEFIGWCSECQHRICTYCLINKGDIDSRYAHDYDTSL